MKKATTTKVDYRDRLIQFTWKRKVEIFALAIVLMILLAGCGGGEKVNEEVKVGDAKIIGIYTRRDGSKQIDILFRRIYETIKYDSVKKEKVIVIDTLVGLPVIVKAVDSVGNIIKTKAGADSLNPIPVYVPIGKDSVNWHVENISIDSLLKK